MAVFVLKDAVSSTACLLTLSIPAADRCILDDTSDRMDSQFTTNFTGTPFSQEVQELGSSFCVQKMIILSDRSDQSLI